jgi:hypothetical protein
MCLKRLPNTLRPKARVHRCEVRRRRSSVASRPGKGLRQLYFTDGASAARAIERLAEGDIVYLRTAGDAYWLLPVSPVPAAAEWRAFVRLGGQVQML